MYKTQNPIVFLWLFVCFALVFLMIIIGAITRLTDSGLSMVEWRPIYGFLPPLTEMEWQRVFDLYKLIPEYKYQNFGMSLEDFKSIFWWEYIHRLWGRIIGIVYTIPLCVFWWRGMLPRGWKLGLSILLILGGVQGFIGWWMVKSGLSQNLDVSAFRLMVHLGMALIIVSGLWLFLLKSRKNVSRETFRSSPMPKTPFYLLWLLVYCTILSGALVAGNDAGLVYSDWPYMGGQWIPDSYSRISFDAFFVEQGSVQFHHRTLAYLLGVVVLFLVVYGLISQRITLAIKLTIFGLFLLLSLQITLGVLTLASTVDTGYAIMHHVNAVVMLLCVTTLLHLKSR